MATKTANYGLHQWVPEDNFLRTDFNEDFLLIDSAVHGVQTALDAAVQRQQAELSGAVQVQQAALDTLTQRTEKRLGEVSYNVLQLYLQRYYESKPVGMKKALLLDGFRDSAQVAAFSGGCGLGKAGGVLLDTVGLHSAVYNFGTDAYTFLPATDSRSLEWEFVPEGNGTLTGVTLNLSSPSVSTVRFQISRKDVSGLLFNGTLEVTGTSEYAPKPFTYSMNVPVESGATYRMYLHTDTYTSLYVYRGPGQGVGMSITATNHAGTTGGLTSRAYTAADYDRAWAWVRHSAGTVGAALKSASSGFLPMTPAGVRQTVTVQGTSCLESAFLLETPPAKPNGTVSLQLTISNQSNATIHDYGVALL